MLTTSIFSLSVEPRAGPQGFRCGRSLRCKAIQPVRARQSTATGLQPAESAKAALARQLPTADITVHFDRFFTLRQREEWQQTH